MKLDRISILPLVLATTWCVSTSGQCTTGNLAFTDLVEGSEWLNIGDWNVIDAINQVVVEAMEEEETGTLSIFPPQLVCANSAQSIPDLSDLASCQTLDFLDSLDVYAFGTEENGIGLCFGVKWTTSDHTIGLGQVGILPPVTIANVFTLELNAVGFSLEKKLSQSTKNNMWKNQGDPAPLLVYGHMIVRGTGSVGVDFSDLVTMAIVLEGALLIDADAGNNGVIPQVITTDSSTSVEVDFAILVTGQAGPVFTVKRLLPDNTEEETEIDLTQIMKKQIDVYLLVNNESTNIQFADSISITMQGICDTSGILNSLCALFHGDTSLTGAVRGYADNSGFGIQFEINGRIRLQSDVLNDLVGWPTNGASFDAKLSVVVENRSVETCVAANGGSPLCMSFCTSDSHCASGKFCNVGFCVDKRGLGGACLSDSVCTSNLCRGGFCSECPAIDSLSNCPSDKFCTQTAAIGYRCESKRGRGGTCSSNNACSSGKCDAGFCVDCYRDGNGCSSSQYCDLGQCKTKLGRGSVCVENRVCSSGKCDVGFCVDCYRSGAGCSSSQYCDLGQCKNKLNRGSACIESRVCKSNRCSWFFCT